MADRKAMGWVTRLYEVGDVVLKECESFQFKMDKAAALEAKANAIRAEAYFDSLRLEARCSELWTVVQIEQAKRIYKNAHPEH
jgi:hypothetical protein